MAATITYSSQNHGSVSPVRGGPEGLELHVVDFVPDSSYSAGGDVFTMPDEIKGKSLAFIAVLAQLGKDVDGDVLYAWNGSTSSPKITATVISTGAEASGDLSNDALVLLVGVRS